MVLTGIAGVSSWLFQYHAVLTLPGGMISKVSGTVIAERALDGYHRGFVFEE